MKASTTRRSSLYSGLVGLALLATVGMTGCQYEVGGQTLPSPYYLGDDVQYYAPGPAFKLQKEAAAQKAYSDEQQQAQSRR